MKAKKVFLFLISSSLIFYSCKKESNSSDTKTSTDSTTNTSNPLTLQLVNAVRAKGCTCGTTVMPAVSALTWNDVLASVALAHSKDMNANNYFSHTGLDGSDPGERITKAGYVWSAYGENIAEGYSDEQSVMNAWLQSEGHCKNIMDGNFKEMGAGNDEGYWTQDFGSK